MSGVVAIFNRNGAPVDREVLRRVTEFSAHRGPDGVNYWVEGAVGLAHQALHATPEAVRERQPLLARDGLVFLTADARIDNRAELLEALGRETGLSSESTDAEYILEAYRCWGIEFPAKLIGDFAVIVWDAARKTLVAARDALGVRTLHWGQAGQMLCLASEAQQVLQHPQVPRRLDLEACADYLTNSYGDEERTFFCDVKRIPAAHRLIATPAAVRVERYWDIDPAVTIRYRRDEDYVEHFLGVFRRAVADRLRTQ
ncbi:MAG: asparagine synthetase B, partial [Acidobacteriota bacterium]